MSNDNNDQRVDQLLRGIYRLCINMDSCYACPFYRTGCTFEEPKPRTWFGEEKAGIPGVPTVFEHKDNSAAGEQPQEKEDSEGTWLVSTSMGGVFSKYVFICSKCGYKKESVLSLTPMSTCPECEKMKARNS